MWSIGPLGFAAPWILLGLIILPLLWLLLRAVPPAPVRRRFPGVALLLGLSDANSQSDRTPWWLLLLRLLAIAGVIIGFAGPVLNPQVERVGDGPLLVLIDGTWADARDWQRRVNRIDVLLSEAAQSGRPVALVSLTDLPPQAPVFQAADAVATRLPALTPAPFAPDSDALTAFAETLTANFDTFWLSDGLARDSRAPLLDALETHGTVSVFESPRTVMALRPARFENGDVMLTATRAPAAGTAEAVVLAIGLDPAGVERQLASLPITWDAGQSDTSASLTLPPELRNRVTRFELAGVQSAGAVTLTDDALRRREVALIAGGGEREGLELLSPLHYLNQALEPTADLIEGTLADVLLANPDVIVLADVAVLTAPEQEAMLEWLDKGGLLLRFAGPRLAGSDIGRATEDPLLPVRLRAGGRSIGGAMSWGEPKALAPFSDTSPFFGLAVPDDVSVSAQVMAQPDPTLSGRVIAALSDGTPLVTRKGVGAGQIVLFHVTANAEWSSLPLSGLFVQMLERLAVSTRPAQPEETELAGTTWMPEDVLNGFGVILPADTLSGVSGERLATGVPAADMPPGLYSGEARKIAVNIMNDDTEISTMRWPTRITVEGLDVTAQTLLKGWVLGAALCLLVIDILASLFLSGRLTGPRAQAAAIFCAAFLMLPDAGQAQDVSDDFAVASLTEVVLAHVITGDAQVDDIAQAGLYGLSQTLYRRTSIEPALPIGVNIETDELAFFPILYWPITANQPLPSADAYAKLNRYLRTGGMILFDTRDADLAGFGTASPEGRRLQAIARLLDIPPLEPIPNDHVLTRTFYLLQDFPGRYAGREVWVEASPPDAEQVEGMPFRDLNDGVTPVVI
ncbi:MAG: hypothetical protein ACI86S_000601, partial [Paracoccaceae bacterium]